ncbi:MAG: LLM class flavin-dependent oxidoreductase, partial [Planctomycetaceae bacterium]|nr:LLM class flavin-dependent oxidoreductase [Planctomycetaceae bacterium]
MKVGIGLPNSVPGTSGEEMTGFARRAEAQGLSSLGTIDRVLYHNWEPLVALAAAAAVTERIELMTTVMLGPLRLNAVQTAKQALSVNELSGGRLTLGIGLGARGDDYAVSGVEQRD